MAISKTGGPVLEVRGKIGNIVYQRAGDALLMRQRVIPHDPKTASQLTSRMLLTRIAVLWKGLTSAQFTAWSKFAPANPYRTFSGLTAKWLRLHPNGQPSLMPPAGPFFGDALTVSLLPNAVLLHTDLPAEAHLCGEDLVEVGVITEILIQKLANSRRRPRDKGWITAGYLSFASGTLSQSIPVPPGAYAVAYRFVYSSTGQSTEMVRIGALDVAG